MPHPLSVSLVDLIGTEPNILYQTGQGITALQNRLGRQPSLRIVVLRMEPPLIMALSGQRVLRPSSPLSLQSDMRHTQHLNTSLHGELGVHAVDPGSVLKAGKVFEVRGEDLERISEATRAVAAARDAALQAPASRRGLLGLLKAGGSPSRQSRELDMALATLLDVMTQARGHQLGSNHLSPNMERVQWEDV
ncbi:hypothetical protein [Deinococcus navajonensis]|uniref:Uncharacterized protein n=1 Tax=Deinococcus navajonensis TaxID=309884 RepID=A0ABV8XSN8_9DEIO